MKIIIAVVLALSSLFVIPFSFADEKNSDVEALRYVADFLRDAQKAYKRGDFSEAMQKATIARNSAMNLIAHGHGDNIYYLSHAAAACSDLVMAQAVDASSSEGQNDAGFSQDQNGFIYLQRYLKHRGEASKGKIIFPCRELSPKVYSDLMARASERELVRLFEEMAAKKRQMEWLKQEIADDQIWATKAASIHAQAKSEARRNSSGFGLNPEE